MSVTLRLQRRGQTKRPFYRLVAADTEARRDGRYLELIGTYNPMVNPPAITMKEDRVKYWVAAGALQTDMARSLIKKQIPGLIEAKEAKKKESIQAKRAKRKAKVSAKKK